MLDKHYKSLTIVSQSMIYETGLLSPRRVLSTKDIHKKTYYSMMGLNLNQRAFEYLAEICVPCFGYPSKIVDKG